MITYFETSLNQISVHRVGNKVQDEFYILSEQPLNIEDEVLKSLLIKYFLPPFEKTNEVYRFTHSSGDLNLNELFHFSSMMFSDEASFHELSGNIAKYLMKSLITPKLKQGSFI